MSDVRRALDGVGSGDAGPMAAFRAAHPDAADLYRRWPDALNAEERHMFGIAV
jgi:hypothetical protein